MTYFEDLSRYSYFRDGGEKNVGWLDAEKPFEKGKVCPKFIKNLEAISRVSVHATRGLYFCNICRDETFVLHDMNGKKIFLGEAEIRVFSNCGMAFAAPNLLLHYIKSHNYLPPKEFVDAVMTGPLPPDLSYFDRLSSLKVEWETKSFSDPNLKMR